MAYDKSGFSSRIIRCYDSLPRAERRLADLCLGKGRDIVNYQAGQIAEEAGVSRATVARFFQKLGYTTFRAARSDIINSHTAEEKPPIAEKPNNINTEKRRIYLSTEIQNIRRTFNHLSEEVLTPCVSLLANAEKLWVVGFEDDYALAHFARSLLIRVKPDIRMIPLSGFSIAEEFASISNRDAILCFGVKRKPIMLRKIIDSGSSSGAKIILVTNEHHPDDQRVILLPCVTRGASIFDSITSSMSFTTYLCSLIAHSLGTPALERLKSIENLHCEWDIHNP